MRHLLSKILTLLVLSATSLTVHAGESDRVFMVYDSSNGLATNACDILLCMPDGRIMVMTRGHVNFFDGARFSHLDPLASDAYQLPQYYGHYQIYFDRFNHLWVKDNGVMACVDLTTEKFVDVASVLKEQHVTKPVHDIFGDGVSNVWFRSGRQLFSTAVNKSIDIQSPEIIQDVDVYNDRLILLFHIDGSVGVYDYKTCRFLYQDDAFTLDAPNTYTNTSEICLVGHQYFQVRSDDHSSILLRYDVNSRQWKRLMTSPIHINAIYPKDDLLYLGTDFGYMVYDTKTDKYEHIKMLKLTKGRTQHAHVESLAFDQQGGLWIGTERRGLLYCKPHLPPFKTYSWDTPIAERLKHQIDLHQPVYSEPLPRKVNCIFTDSRNWKWTGTYNGLVLDKPNGDHQVFRKKDGLTNDVVHSIVEDVRHDIWVSTSFGITYVQVKDGEVIHVEPYVIQDNVPNETFLDDRAISQGDSIIMEALDHVVVFTPTKFHFGKFVSILIHPLLVRLSVNGHDMGAGDDFDGNVVTEKALSQTDEINLTYNLNSVALTFSALNYLRGIQTYYRVRIKGVPEYDDWRVLAYGKSEDMVDKYGHLRLPLLGLEPGTYEVEVQASFWPDEWPEAPRVWRINVQQPWWRTTGLYLTLCIVLLILFVLNFIAYNTNLRLRVYRNNDEADLLRRIKGFVARSETLASEELSPLANEEEEPQNDRQLDEFVEAMLHIVPFVNDNQERKYHISDLAAVAGVKSEKLYELLTVYIDKSPRLLLLPLRLQQAAQLLTTTNLSVDEIGRQCHFVTTAYFVSSFRQRYGMTPADYRVTMPR